MSKVGLSSQILQNTRRYTGKPICVTSFSGAPMRICYAVRDAPFDIWGGGPRLFLKQMFVFKFL